MHTVSRTRCLTLSTFRTENGAGSLTSNGTNWRLKMKIYDTSTADLNALSEREVDYIYNGLDCCITHELVDKLRLKLEPKTTGQICRFTGALQNICLDMTLTGIRIDPVAKQKVILETEKKRDEAQALLDELSLAFYGQTINPKSTKQC